MARQKDPERMGPALPDRQRCLMPEWDSASTRGGWQGGSLRGRSPRPISRANRWPTATNSSARPDLPARVQAVEADLVTWNSVESYDLILCVDVMEHIEEDRTVFSNFRR
jgi:hypothetical protein